MKKLFKVVALLLVSAIAAVALASCNPNSADESIVGYWQTEYQQQGSTGKAGLNFKDDGTVDIYMDDGTGWKYNSLGTYTFDSDSFTIVDSDGTPASIPYTRDGDKMTFDIGPGNMTYTKTSIPQNATFDSNL